jgi:hypothetical protein
MVEETTTESRLPIDWTTGALAEGLDCFARGDYFAAHERWEDAWRPSTGVERHLLQALVQIAVALLLEERANLRGALGILRKSRGHLEHCTPDFAGVETAQLCAELTCWIEHLADPETTQRPPLPRLPKHLLSEIEPFSEAPVSLTNLPRDEQFRILAEAWIAYFQAERNSPDCFAAAWATDLYDLEYHHPELLWSLILAIHERDRSARIQQVLSAGPVESLLALHGDKFIERVEAQAKADPAFAKLLGGVWQNRMPEAIWQRLQQVWDRRGWDGIPE